MSIAPDSTSRFSNRVADYVAARPTYPPDVVGVLRRAVGLDASWTVADVGAGTGISTRLFLANGNEVFAVEPNDAMRAAAELAFAAEPHFHSIRGTAEATTLRERSVNLVVAAQAFHWFDRRAFREECRRILKPRGFVLLLWNDRKATGSAFLDGYEALLDRFGTDYQAVNHRNVGDADVTAFFAPAPCTHLTLQNAQQFDLPGLRARLLSSSYAPPADDPRAGPMLAELDRLFAACQANGTVTMEYDVQLYLGPIH